MKGNTAVRRLLVVDDELVIGKGFEAALRGEDWAPTFVSEPTRLEQAFEGGAAYALAFVDLVMPKRDGLEVVTWLQEHHPETRVVFMSGLTEDATAEKGRKAGASVFLPKPFTKRELLDVIAEVMTS